MNGVSVGYVCACVRVLELMVCGCCVCCVCVCCVCVHVCVYLCVRVGACMHVCVCMCVCVSLCACGCVWVRACMCVSGISVCACVCIIVCGCVCGRDLLSSGVVSADAVVDKYNPCSVLVRVCENGLTKFAQTLIKHEAEVSPLGEMHTILQWRVQPPATNTQSSLSLIH